MSARRTAVRSAGCLDDRRLAVVRDREPCDAGQEDDQLATVDGRLAKVADALERLPLARRYRLAPDRDAADRDDDRDEGRALEHAAALEDDRQ